MGSSWHWLRLPSGKIVNMALVERIDQHDGTERTKAHIRVHFMSGDDPSYTDADAAAILAWVPRQQPVAAEPETTEDA